jgi:hypothetical protein
MTYSFVRRQRKKPRWGGTGLLRFPDQENGDDRETITESEPDKFKLPLAYAKGRLGVAA